MLVRFFTAGTNIWQKFKGGRTCCELEFQRFQPMSSWIHYLWTVLRQNIMVEGHGEAELFIS
jgi:hypothetical protein